MWVITRAKARAPVLGLREFRMRYNLLGRQDSLKRAKIRAAQQPIQ